MCGRYTLSKKARLEEMMKEAGFIFEEFSHTRLTYEPRYNISPTQLLPVLLDTRKAVFAKWGLLPFWAKDEKAGASMINARKETVAEKPAFRSAFKKRRCLVPADGFYEWKKVGKFKLPHRFIVGDGELFTFAGLWETWKKPDGEELLTYTIITTEPNPLVQPVHDRMPVILPPDKRDAWLDPATSPDTLKSLLVPYPAEAMRAYAVSSAVSSPKNDTPSLIDPLPEGGFKSN